MLDQLVESKSNADAGSKRGGLLLTVGILAFALAFGGLLYSLFAQNIGVGGDGLELSTLVAPVPLPEEAPPPPDEPEPEKQKAKAVTEENVDVRREIIKNINESPVKPPDKVQTTRSDVRARRENATTVLGNTDSNASSSAPTGPVRDTGNSGGRTLGPKKPETVEKPKPASTPKPPPPPPPKKTPTPKPKVPKRISGGVVNGKAISLPKPAYPAAARAVRASGAVRVSVVISKTGRVISASASGHPLLKSAALSAARRAKFRPTMLSGQPVEVSGVIIYNFRP